MNLCKRFKKLILTEYIDAQMGRATKEYIAAHLRVCFGCRAFAEEARRKLVSPFEGVKHVSVPDTLWPAIEEKISERAGYLENAKRSLAGRWKEYFSFPRLSPVLVGFTMLVLIGTLVFCGWQTRGAKEKERADYLSSFLGTTAALLETTTSDFGTLIEEFFL